MEKVPDSALRGLTGYRLHRANAASAVAFKSVFAQFGLRRTTFSCLSLIVETPGLRQSQLGTTLAIERPNLVNIVEDLTRQGLIQKDVCPEDRRAYALSPTAKGRALFRQAFDAVEALDAELTQGLSKAQRAALREALDLLGRNAARLKV